MHRTVLPAVGEPTRELSEGDELLGGHVDNHFASPGVAMRSYALTCATRNG
jgi:hypothetical protein